MTENINQNEAHNSKNFTVLLIDDMADIYSKELNKAFTNVSIINLTDELNIDSLKDIDKLNNICLLIDATLHLRDFDDNAVIVAEELLKQNPNLKSKIAIMLGDDVFKQMLANAMNGDEDAQIFRARIRSLPRTIYTNKVNSMKSVINSFAKSQNFTIQHSEELNSQSLPPLYVNSMQELRFSLKYLYNLNNPPISPMAFENLLNSHPAHNDLMIAIRQFFRQQCHIAHSIGHVCFMMSANNINLTNIQQQKLKTRTSPQDIKSVVNRIQENLISIEVLTKKAEALKSLPPVSNNEFTDLKNCLSDYLTKHLNEFKTNFLAIQQYLNDVLNENNPQSQSGEEE